MGVAPSGILRIELGQFLLGLFLDLPPDAAQFLGELRPVARDVLQHHLEDQAGHGIQVAGEGLAAQPQRLQRDRAAPGERVHHQRRFLAMRRLDQSPAHLQVYRMVGIVPVGEVADELEQGLAQVFIFRADCSQKARQQFPGLLLEILGAVSGRPGPAKATPRASPGKPPAAAAPTTDGAWTDAHAGWTSPAPSASTPRQSGNPPRPGVCIPWGSSSSLILCQLARKPGIWKLFLTSSPHCVYKCLIRLSGGGWRKPSGPQGPFFLLK